MDRPYWMGMVCGLLFVFPMVHVLSQTTLMINEGYSVPSDGTKSSPARLNHSWWVDLGAGPAFAGRTFAMGAGMVYCYQLDRWIISGRILGVTNYNPTAQEIDKSSTIYKMSDYGVLFGRVWQTDYGYASAGAGVGLVRAAYQTPIHITTNTSISMPLEVQWFWRFTEFAGLGCYSFAAINFEKPLYGIMVCAQLGAW